MCDNNHPVFVATALATPELGTRLLCYHREVGLTPQQLDQVADIARRWRERYIELAEPIVALGHEVDEQLLQRHVDLGRVDELAANRRQLIGEAEREFFRAWESLRRVVDDEQYERSIGIYRREFAHLPHPAMGTTAWEPPIGETDDRSGPSAS